MNAQNAHEYLPLVQALADGKTIQADQCGDGEWTDMFSFHATLDPERYRIKPEPRTFEMWRNIETGSMTTFESEENSWYGHTNRYERITVQEVLS